MHACTVRDSAFRIELFLVTDDPHDRERFARWYRLATPFGAKKKVTATKSGELAGLPILGDCHLFSP